MKKIISLALACLTLISTLAFVGCGETFTCAGCNKEKTGKKIALEFGGEVMGYMCSDCDKALAAELENLG